MPKARAHRHLSALREHGYVTQDATSNHYRVGWQLYLLGRACVGRFDLMTLAKPALQRFHALCRAQLQAHRGREIDTAGDGYFAIFDGPARAMRCARSMVRLKTAT